MKIDDRTLDHVAALANLELTAEGSLTRERARADLEKILEYMEKMNELDTEGVEPMSHVLPLKNVFREDMVQPDIIQPESKEDAARKNREELLCNAPVQKDACFVVPKTVE